MAMKAAGSRIAILEGRGICAEASGTDGVAVGILITLGY
jgi:hypothetical protein